MFKMTQVISPIIYSNEHGINRDTCANLMGLHPCCIWFTGLSGSGKSTLSNLLVQHLRSQGLRTYLLDGDNIRCGLSRDLGFSDAERHENIRRVAEVARLMVNAGLIAIVAFISPFKAERRMARELFKKEEFIEVFVDTSLGECEHRDPKGLYAKARKGLIGQFTGINSPYEPPESPEIHVKTATLGSPEICVQHVVRYLINMNSSSS